MRASCEIQILQGARFFVSKIFVHFNSLISGLLPFKLCYCKRLFG